LRRRRWALRIGIALLIAGTGLVEADPAGLATLWRERAFDLLGTTFPRKPSSARVVVVDIDRAALASIGPWPWPRESLAALTSRIAAGSPRVIALDILLSAGNRGDVIGDKVLRKALRQAPDVLGIVLDPDASDSVIEGPPILAAGPVNAPDMMAAPGIAAPALELRVAARGFGVISLPAPDGEPVRAVPLLAAGGGEIFAGLAVEAIRIAEGEVTLIVEAGASIQRLRIGETSVPLNKSALMRLYSSPAAHHAARTISAAALMANPGLEQRLSGRIVLLGVSAPEAGGSLRPTAADAFTPSVQIEADAVEQLLDGQFLLRPRGLVVAERIGLILLAVGAIAAALSLSPLPAITAFGVLAAIWVCGAALVFRAGGLLVDPLLPPAFAGVVFQGAVLAGYAATRRERRAIERSFAQHLSPAVVQRIANNPGQLRLSGEQRVVTALFTDIEGFTAMTERVSSEQLVDVLNSYIEKVSSIIIHYGGMIDKVVGDAVHAFFNMPLDLDNHASRAVRCAMAIIDATEALRREAGAAANGLGRTRIGIETGTVVVGDFGGGGKLDYTAHGPAINTAAKLEVANKRFGSSIAVGPGTVRECPDIAFRIVGQIVLTPDSAPIVVSEPDTPES
jgi:adenylate cyclase